MNRAEELLVEEDHALRAMQATGGQANSGPLATDIATMALAIGRFGEGSGSGIGSLHDEAR